MKELFVPDRMLGSYRELTPALLESLGIRALLIDIDNTLAPYEQEDPDEAIRAWFSALEEAGIRAALVSNNHPPRVERFNATLGLLAYADSKKPCRGTLLLAMKELGVSREECAVLGDQLLTDVWGGKRLGLFAFAVPPIRDKKNLFFRFKRCCERPFVRKYAKRHGYEEWMAFWHVKPPHTGNEE